jgi:hypothetical protein
MPVAETQILFNIEDFLLIIRAAAINEIITDALTTDGERPVINEKHQINAIMEICLINLLLNLFPRKGNRMKLLIK